MRETEGGQSPEYILKSSKNTIFYEPPVYRKTRLKERGWDSGGRGRKRGRGKGKGRWWAEVEMNGEGGGRGKI